MNQASDPPPSTGARAGLPPLPTPAAVLEQLQQGLQRLSEVGPARDFEKNARALLASAATRLDLVPREEFDAALAQLQAARIKLHALEQRIAALEAQRPSPAAETSARGG
jgi:BMFP domain-containing protein YqiC